MHAPNNIIQYNRRTAFAPAFSEPQPHWPRDPPSPLLGQSGGEARAAGVSPRGYPPVPPHRFSKFSDYHLITLINRVDADSTCRIQRELIIEQHKPTAQHHQRSAARKTEATYSTTVAPTRHPLPIRRQHTPNVPHDTPTHRPSHPPTKQPTHHATAVQHRTDALFRTRISPEQVGYIAERTKQCRCTKENNSSTSHRHESTHPRTKQPPLTHPPTQPTASQPDNQSYHQTLQPICATAVQQYVPAGTYTS